MQISKLPLENAPTVSSAESRNGAGCLGSGRGDGVAAAGKMSHENSPFPFFVLTQQKRRERGRREPTIQS